MTEGNKSNVIYICSLKPLNNNSYIPLLFIYVTDNYNISYISIPIEQSFSSKPSRILGFKKTWKYTNNNRYISHIQTQLDELLKENIPFIKRKSGYWIDYHL